VHIVNVANLLVGNYNVAEHNAYQGLRHGRLNHIFELARVLYQPRPELIVRKHKPAAATLAPLPRETSGKCGRGRKSFDFGTQTSALEVTLAKLVKRSNKFIAKSSRLIIVEKATAMTIKIAGKKTHSASAGGSDTIQASTRALDLFGSSSSASDDETTPREPPHKHPRIFVHPKGVPKSSVMRSNFEWSLSLFCCFKNYDGEPFLFVTAKMIAALSASAAKDLGVEDVHTTESPSSREPPIEIEAALTRETSMLDIALALGRRGTINHDAVCGLLTECLQDVSFAILAMSYLFAH
jgi:hypothetical protein